jgi:predicted alpha/beta-hydrolase family hydrolase
MSGPRQPPATRADRHEPGVRRGGRTRTNPASARPGGSLAPNRRTGAASWVLAAILWLAGASLAAAQNADYAREQRWAQEIIPGLVVGEPVELKLGSGRTFLAIHTPAKNARAGVIVVHGMGLHPDWGLVNVLRSALPDAGYATLSVQMPVLGAEARPDEYPPTFAEASERLRVAVAWLRRQGHASIAIVAHSLGARMSNRFLVEEPRPEIAAFVAIGLSGELEQPDRLGLPVLDLHGERDLPAVLGAAASRTQTLHRLPGSSQVQVSGADHFFTDREEPLVQWVRRFLDRTIRR